MNSRTIHIEGVPAPGGSKTPFRNKHTGRIHMVDAGKNNAGWKQLVAAEARRQRGTHEVLTGALGVVVEFRLPRPKGHMGKRTPLKPSAPRHHEQTPDATKLWRSTEDALSKVVWGDDSQIVGQVVWKRWCEVGEPPGATVIVGPVGEMFGAMRTAISNNERTEQ